ncbi:YhcN/YlaJ family sporulation lipoprotein [Clostridiaceae bacterium 35-E11]
MKRYRSIGILVTCVMLVVALALGCTPARRPIVDRDQDIGMRNPYTAPEPENQNGGMTNPVNPDGDRSIGENVDLGTRPDNNQAAEEKIAREVKKVPGVKDAVVLMNNNTAYIGIDIGQNIENAQTNNIKDQVMDKVKRIEPAITRVYVSADVDVFGRLTQYGRDVRAGQPIRGFIDEIEEMFRRPMPETSR